MRKKRLSKPLFDLDEDDEMRPTLPHEEGEDDDPEVALAIQESLELAEESELQQAIEASRVQMPSTPKAGSSSKMLLDSSQKAGVATLEQDTYSALDSEDEEDLYASPMRLETALSIANAGPSRGAFPRSDFQPQSLFLPAVSPAFGDPSGLLPSEPSTSVPSEPSEKINDSDDDMEEVSVQPTPTEFPFVQKNARAESPGGAGELPTPKPPLRQDLPPPPMYTTQSESDDEMEEIAPMTRNNFEPVIVIDDEMPPSPHEPAPSSKRPTSPSLLAEPLSLAADEERIDVDAISDHAAVEESHDFNAHPEENVDKHSSDVEPSSPESSSASLRDLRDSPHNDQEPQGEGEGEDWDAAQEMDPQAEEGEFARFISQVQGKDIEEIRNEIEEEIRALNEQKKIAMRDSEDITQQMISQIMVGFSFHLDRLQSTLMCLIDHVASFWYTLYYSTDGSRSSMRRAPLFRSSRRDHHRRLRRIPLRWSPSTQEHV